MIRLYILLIFVLSLSLLGFALQIIANNELAGEAHAEANARPLPLPHSSRAAPEGQPDRIALTWSEDPTTTLSVAWRTDASVRQGVAEIVPASPPSESRGEPVSFNAITDSLHISGDDTTPVRVHYHAVTFSELEPATMYAYRVGDGLMWSDWFHAETASPSPEPFSFIYIGQSGYERLNLDALALRSAYRQAPEARFVVHAGNLVRNAHNDANWKGWFEAGGWIHGTLPALPVPGRNEYGPTSKVAEPARLSRQWRHQFTLPRNGIAGLEETTYYVDYQGARFIAMDSNRLVDEQADWLDDALRSNPHRWSILIVYEREDTAPWDAVIEAHQVPLVLRGNNTVYARGRTHVARADTDPLFQVVDVSPDTLTYRSFTITGEIHESFHLIHHDEQRPPRYVADMLLPL